MDQPYYTPTHPKSQEQPPILLPHEMTEEQRLDEEARDEAWIQHQSIIEAGRYAQGDYEDFVF